MTERTPTTEEVRKWATFVPDTTVGMHVSERDAAAFDRWLAAHDAEVRAEANTPSPCEMTHTPPFDFAQCETHDTTFPLGGVCKWHGKESITAVLEDEADEQRGRAVRAEMERDDALAELRARTGLDLEALAEVLYNADMKMRYGHVKQSWAERQHGAYKQTLRKQAELILLDYDVTLKGKN